MDSMVDRRKEGLTAGVGRWEVKVVVSGCSNESDLKVEEDEEKSSCRQLFGFRADIGKVYIASPSSNVNVRRLSPHDPVVNSFSVGSHALMSEITRYYCLLRYPCPRIVKQFRQ